VKRWIFAIALLAVVVLAAIYGFELRARHWEAKWVTFVKHWEAKGESFGVEKNLPAAMAEADEFALHPWIRRIAAGDPEVLERLGEMDPKAIAGYVEWQSAISPDDASAPMPVELADRVRKHAAEFRVELDAFAEALRRPGCRFSPLDAKASPNFADWANHLVRLSHLLEASSHAAIAMDDAKAFTESIEISLRAGEKLRASNLMLPIVVGCGFEGVAYQSLRSVPASSVWPQRERGKWLDALDYRSRSLEDEYVAASRVDRGLFLLLFGSLEDPSVTALPRFSSFRRVFLARAKLEPCEAMQGILLAPAGNLTAPADAERISRFESFTVDERYKSDPAMSLGLGMLVGPRRGIYHSMQTMESDRAAIRQKLRDAR
jgi:hypothetical protein